MGVALKTDGSSPAPIFCCRQTFAAGRIMFVAGAAHPWLSVGRLDARNRE